MASNITDLLKENFPLPFYPKVSATPKIAIYILSFPGFESTAFKELLYAQLPRYWSSPGIVDCKMLFAAKSNTAVLIESWECAEAATAFRQSKAWTSFQHQIKAKDVQLEAIVNDSFELIE